MVKYLQLYYSESTKTVMTEAIKNSGVKITFSNCSGEKYKVAKNKNMVNEKRQK